MAGVVAAAGCAARRAPSSEPGRPLPSVTGAAELEAAGDFDGAVEALSLAVVAPGATVEVFQELQKAALHASPATREKLSHLGESAVAPLHVPARRWEYSWVGAFACVGDHPRVVSQSLLMQDPGGAVDELTFACGAGPERRTFFAVGAQ
jgi:hypothetical protein